MTDKAARATPKPPYTITVYVDEDADEQKVFDAVEDAVAGRGTVSMRVEP